MNTLPTKTLQELKSPCEDYDPNAMSVDDARHTIRQFLSQVQEVETLPIRESLGRALAKPIVSEFNVPNHHNSAMDGYAFRCVAGIEATPLVVVGSAFAGTPFTGHVNAGECVRIMTGAVVPADTDTVVAQERVMLQEGKVLLNEGPKPNMNVRYAGEDIQQGQVVLDVGHLMQSADLGLVASLGVAEVAVYRRLRVAFFSTGDELTAVGQPLQEGQIYDSNRYTLHGMLSRLGVELLDFGAIPDDPVKLEATLVKAAAEADVVITSGGVSVGEADYMKQLLEKLGQVLFWKLAMKPGRPLAYGKIGHAQYFGLPGNPVAVMVTFYQFVRDALLYMMGQTNSKKIPTFSVKCISQIKKMRGRTEFVRGLLFEDAMGEWVVKPTGNQSSGVLSSMSQANCFIVLGHDDGNLEAGSVVKVQVLDSFI